MKISYHISLRSLTILLLCTVFLLSACNKTHEKSSMDSIDKNKKAPSNDSVELQEPSSDIVSSQKPDKSIEEIEEDEKVKTAEETKVEEAANTGDTADIISNPKIIVRKSDRILELWDNDSLYGSYPIGLGWEPVGDKQKEGDGRTPEGTYYVCTRNNYSRFYLSLGVSYPNKEDADEAIEAGYIDQSTHQQIVDAINQNKQPPWNTALGGEIMIHGHGAQSDWTAGCVAVENNIMDILWDNCPLGTPIIIMP